MKTLNPSSFFIKRKDTLNHIILLLPVLIVYQLGIVTTGIHNGADLISSFVVETFQTRGFYVFQGLVFTTLLSFIFVLRRRQKSSFRYFWPVLIESSLYALTMGPLIILVMTDLLKMGPLLGISNSSNIALTTSSLCANLSYWSKFIISAGAGFNEEILFRLGIFTSAFILLNRILGYQLWLSFLIATLTNALLFSFAHHIGPSSDPFSWSVFVFRAIAGCFFSLLYHFRGISVAVYTHTIYDIYVLFFYC